MKKLLSMTAITASIMLLSGCSSIPKPAPGKEKPTVYIESKTAEKFKDLTEETAIWNGISPYYVKDKQYMRCDMTHEMMAAFVYNGFELVHDIKNADYKVDVEVDSCSPEGMYSRNRSSTPIAEKILYKNFAKFVENEKNGAFAKDSAEVLALISKNDSEGFKRFHDGRYIEKLNSMSTGNWEFLDRQDRDYLSKAKGIVFPNKYYMMSDADKEAISHYYKVAKENANLSQTSSHVQGIEAFGGGANMVGNYGSGSLGGNIGTAFMGVGLLMALNGTMPPVGIDKFTIENTKNGKKTIVFGEMKEHSWNNNIMHLRGFTFGGIKWKDLD